jgi:hypothetical protein
MDRRRYRWTLRIAAVLVGGVAFVLWALQPPPPNLLTIANQSTQPIALLNITVAGHRSVFKDVAVGAEVSAPLPAKGEAKFTVEGQLADGTVIRGNGLAVKQLNFVVQPTGGLTLKPAGKS